MRIRIKQHSFCRHGSAIALVVISMVILAILGVGVFAATYRVRHRAIAIKNETVALLAAEAGYEKAIFWMCQQPDMLNTLTKGVPGTSGTISLPGSYCDYQIEFFALIGSRPVYRIISNGHSGVFRRTVDVFVVHATSDWDMGMYRIVSGRNSTTPVYFADDEIIDMPIHVNNLLGTPDERDIYIQGSPDFLQFLTIGESRYTDDDFDKYKEVMSLFNAGIYFNQPDTKITDEDAVQVGFQDTTRQRRKRILEI